MTMIIVKQLLLLMRMLLRQISRSIGRCMHAAIDTPRRKFCSDWTSMCLDAIGWFRAIDRTQKSFVNINCELFHLSNWFHVNLLLLLLLQRSYIAPLQDCPLRSAPSPATVKHNGLKCYNLKMSTSCLAIYYTHWSYKNP